MSENKKLSWVPEKPAVHTRLNDLAKIRGHQHYYGNLISGKITYRKGSDRIPTGCSSIMTAKSYVETELKARATGESKQKIEREKKGIVNPKVEAVWHEMIEARKVGKAKNTGMNYNKSWNHGIKFFWGDKTIRELTNANLSEYKKAYLKENSDRVFDQTYTHFGMLCRYAFKKKYIPSPLDLKEQIGDLDRIIRSNNQMTAVGRVLTQEESTKILAAVDKYFENSKHVGVSSAHKQMLYVRTKLGILMGMKCGMRKMEILSRKWADYNSKDSFIKVWSMKNKEWREVPLVSEVTEALEEQRKFTGHSEYIFPMPSNPERNISSQVFDKTWEQVKKHSEIPGRLRFHDLRHTFATRTAEMGMPPIVACEILDQSYDTYQNTYCNTSTASKTEWMGKLFGSKKKGKR